MHDLVNKEGHEHKFFINIFGWPYKRFSVPCLFFHLQDAISNFYLKACINVPDIVKLSIGDFQIDFVYKRLRNIHNKLRKYSQYLFEEICLEIDRFK